MRKVFFISLLVFSIFTNSTIAQKSKSEDDYLRILSWNIYMLPGITNLSKEIDKSYKRARAGQIAEVMNNSQYNVIVFQEAFFGPARRILSKKLKAKYPYQYGPVNPSGASFKTSSGVWVVSEVPLKELATTRYRTCDGADCFAKKGAGIWEGEWKGKPFQVVGTHLNAGGPVWIREEQFKQIRDELLQPFQKLNVPQIICGDMNTRMTRTEAYNFMIETLDVIDVPVSNERMSTKPPKIKDGDEIFTYPGDEVFIDYIFHRPNGSNMRVVDKRIVTFKANPVFPVDALHGTLSDHLALEIVVEL